MVRVAVVASFFSLLIFNTEGKKCSLARIQSGNDTRESEPPLKHFWSCPRQENPRNWTECCPGNVTMEICCPPAENRFFRISDTMAMIIAISVTSACTAATVVIIVCCFSSRCPLYSFCRVHYTRSEIATFNKSTDSANMPLEPTSEKAKLALSPHIKNTNMASAV